MPSATSTVHEVEINVEHLSFQKRYAELNHMGKDRLELPEIVESTQEIKPEHAVGQVVRTVLKHILRASWSPRILDMLLIG
jgi:hypothetical protein